MSHQVLFIQGGGEDTHDKWDHKLAESLAAELGPDYEIRYPRMPDEGDPKYALWKAALENEIAKLKGRAIMVGHSIGGTILISFLADEPDLAISGIFLLAAPFVGDGGWSSEDIKPMSGLGRKLPAQIPVHFYHGSEDKSALIEHVGLYEKAVPQAVVHRLTGRDHQLNNDMSDVAADIRRLP